MADDLLVLLYGQVVARLQQQPHQSPTLQYLPDYVRQGSVALSARLPLQGEAYAPERALPFLAGLLPESRGARERWARQLGTDEDDIFAVLAEMGWDCPGAVQFCRPDQLDLLTGRDTRYERLTDADIEERLTHLAEDPVSWTMPDEHWSLGGQQEKFALARIDDAWHSAHGAGATTHIVKPGIRDLHQQALVEHATMAAARMLGVDVAPTHYQRFGDRWAIVIERFDRAVAADGSIVRIHQEDFCQALGRMPERKYEDKGGPTLEDMVRTVRQQSSQVGDDLLALADFLVINVVSGAPDGHSKNLSILRGPHGNLIAPLYDLATALVYDTGRVERKVALSVGGQRLFTRIYAKQWGRAARILALPADLLRARVHQLASGFPAAYDRALHDLGDAPGVDEVRDRSVGEVSAHCDRIIARL
ncbi:HipA domain-containing protein [Phycicoccus sp. CSK15P-2]|uniref:HipA domain-containing protein n=1 Tax=Phycicoccus sp. CSK15P-2 TaxID=2807627 RepID=UPI00194F4BE7|nr:HipA domain-containing protein [Phycicoccus sp. CSK15P-2]MBM6403173.1 HipA domain-containing protein [Phycicoccus sp. CSK15P-2]